MIYIQSLVCVLLGVMAHIEIIWPTHGIYLSVLEVSLDETTISVEVKVFSDDLYDAIKNYRPGTQSTQDNILDEDLNAYFDHYLVLGDGADRIPLVLKRQRVEGDTRFLSFRGSRPENPSVLQLKAGYFFELFPMQQNIVKLTKGSMRRFAIFKTSEQVESFNLSD